MRITYSEDAEGRVILKYSGDAQSIVDACAEAARETRELRPRRGVANMRKIMSVHPHVAMEIAHRHGLDYYDPAIFEYLKDRDYSRFRTVDDKRLFRTKNRVSR